MAAEIGASAGRAHPDGTVRSTVDEWMRLVQDGPAGYVTPKVAVGAVVGNDLGQILLLQRSDSGIWLYPTGWADIGYSASEVAVKEVKEETNIDVEVVRLIGVFDGLRLGFTRIPLYSLVFLCRAVGGELRGHPLETLDVGWFAPDDLPHPTAGVEHWGPPRVRRAPRRGRRRALRRSPGPGLGRTPTHFLSARNGARPGRTGVRVLLLAEEPLHFLDQVVGGLDGPGVGVVLLLEPTHVVLGAVVLLDQLGQLVLVADRGDLQARWSGPMSPAGRPHVRPGPALPSGRAPTARRTAPPPTATPSRCPTARTRRAGRRRCRWGPRSGTAPVRARP